MKVSQLFIRLYVSFVPAILAAQNWAPIPPDQLSLDRAPNGLRLHALLLYRSVAFDDQKKTAEYHLQIKVLTEEGRGRADVEIPFVKGATEVTDLRARTVQPDGRATTFDGAVYEKTVVRARKFRYLAKVFTMPDVQVGSILEYRYTVKRKEIGDAVWQLQSDLYTVHARFSMKPAKFGSDYLFPPVLRWFKTNVRDDLLPKVENDKSVTLDLDGVVAFQSEEYTIPEQELIPSFRFYYMTAPAHYAYWPLTFTGWAETTEKFLGKPASLAEAVASTVSVSDSSEQKLRKLYARVQRVRNLSHEGGRTSQELKREEIKENKSAQDVWKRGYGTGRDIDLLFVALARASGFDSYFVRYAGRNRSFFHRDLLDASQFNGFLAMAKLKKADGGTENVFLDPAVPGLSYGMLDWDSTGVEAVHLDSRGGKFIHIPVELSRGGAILRTAAFDLGASGGLSGSAVVSFTRQDALWRRKQAKEGELDEMQKREDLEDTVRAWLGDGATVQLIRMSGWEDSEHSITAEFSLQIPDFASFTRRRLLAPATVFRTHRLLQQAMQYSNRTLPFYFQYPWEEDDDIIIHLPAGAEVEQLPTPVNKETPLGRYQASCVKEPGALHIKRQLAIREVYYGDPAPLREFFNSVRVNDENLALLRGTAAGVQAQVGSSR